VSSHDLEGGKVFHEQVNPDGTLDLLCLSCRALLGENLSQPNLSPVREAHRCQRGSILHSASGNSGSPPGIAFRLLRLLRSPSAAKTADGSGRSMPRQGVGATSEGDFECR
jgi:hypothetical protein